MKIFKKSIFLFLSIMISAFLLVGCTNSSTNNPSNKDTRNNNNNTEETYKKSKDNILVHYINVGQGDSILIQVNNKNMLIDAGPKDSKDKLLSYLNKINVKRLDYFITTHPHEDHIGGASYVIKSLNIANFYAPKKTHTTKTYRDMINSLKSKNLKIHVAKEGVILDLGKDVVCEMLSPNRSNYEDLNDYSPIIKLKYKDNKFLFTGDAETLVEKDVLSKKYDVSADVLKLGHHGSVSSTSADFLKNVNPKITIATSGKDNKYGHPHRETVSKLKKINCKLYRSDLDGNILVSGDGKNIEVITKN
ncbi:ComEC/Rec2 family competence protein [Clostridium sp. KNHs214]|uniref:ComEC/Rec2 family competence protein n=1 Tax=Clostridium sp. KNHs214 TaxID=1540257 RepID=UPI000553FE52|nr:ComEC/Rec2 family competence protein [Clostridium sp. KNHs214]